MGSIPTTSVKIFGKKYILASADKIRVIAPNEQSLGIIKSAVRILSKSGADYADVMKCKLTIYITSPIGEKSGRILCSSDGGPLYCIDKEVLLSAKGPWQASLLVHEAMHVRDFYVRHREDDRDISEKRACHRQRRFLLRLGKPRLAAKVGKALKGKYWEEYDAQEQKSTKYFWRVYEALWKMDII